MATRYTTLSGQAPYSYSPQVNYTTFAQIASSGNSLVFGPSTINIVAGGPSAVGSRPERQHQHPTVDHEKHGAGRRLYRRLGLQPATVVRHQPDSDRHARSLQSRPTRIRPTATRRCRTSFCEPRTPGSTRSTLTTTWGTTNYNAMTAMLQQRLSHGLVFGAAYTWSRAMGLTAFNPVVSEQRVVELRTPGLRPASELPDQLVLRYPRPRAEDAFEDPGRGGGSLDSVGHLSHPERPAVQSRLQHRERHAGLHRNSRRGRAHQRGRQSHRQRSRRSLLQSGGLCASGDRHHHHHSGSRQSRRRFGRDVASAYTPTWMPPCRSSFRYSANGADCRLQAQAYNVFNHPEFIGLGTGMTYDASGNQTSLTAGVFNSTLPARVMAFSARVRILSQRGQASGPACPQHLSGFRNSSQPRNAYPTNAPEKGFHEDYPLRQDTATACRRLAAGGTRSAAGPSRAARGPARWRRRRSLSAARTLRPRGRRARQSAVWRPLQFLPRVRCARRRRRSQPAALRTGAER